MNDAVWVIIPAYNEATVIASTVHGVRSLDYPVVVVDDGSSDATASNARDAGALVLRHACNLGQGAALGTGIAYVVRQRSAKLLVTFDADGQHDPSDIPRLLEPLMRGECDIVLASRFAEGGRAEGISGGRRAILYLARALTRATTGLEVTDTHNGLRAMTVETARRMSLSQTGMAHASEILSRIASLGLRYREVPATVRYTDYSRRKGQRLSNGINILWDILMERIR
jgi:polyprenyl-phospho-N-acetylgalactosaminyl synthase